MGGHGTYLSCSDVNAGRLCVACSDKCILVSDPSDGSYSALLWKGIQAKVCVVQWHPSEDSLIAFGTHDGQVGLCNSSSNSKTVIFATYHRGSVYKLQWVRENDNLYRLYSVGADGSMFQYSYKQPQQKAMRMNDILISQQMPSNVRMSEFAFSNHQTLEEVRLAIGYVDGSVEIYYKNAQNQWEKRLNASDYCKPIIRLKWNKRLSRKQQDDTSL